MKRIYFTRVSDIFPLILCLSGQLWKPNLRWNQRFWSLERDSGSDYYNLLEDHLRGVKTQVCGKSYGGHASSRLKKLFFLHKVIKKSQKFLKINAQLRQLKYLWEKLSVAWVLSNWKMRKICFLTNFSDLLRPYGKKNIYSPLA